MTHPQQDKAQQNDAQLTPLKRAFLALEEMQNKLAAVQAAAREPIAVIGVGCRFPGGADTPDAYWQFLRSGGEAVSEPPAGRTAAVDGVGGANCAAWLQEPVDAFDPQFFSIAPREAHGMDPQQRLLLEVAWEALENACQAPDRLEGTRTGVFMGVAASDYLHLYLKGADEALFDGYYASGIAHSIASGRLSYLLGLQGPSVSLDTACSSSLSAVHLAVGSLRSGESDMALAGGVNLMLSPENFLAFDRFGMLAADGRCKTFDAAADGFGRGEGCGVVVLKRLSDAQAHGDRVLAVIRGSAMNQDGASSGLTAPNGPAQEAVLRAALDQAGVDPALVSYIETHGTGTSLGDPIEVQALGSVFGPSHSPDRPLRLGAVKASLGHTEAAAGVAGLIKLVLALHHGEIPPQANFHTPSPFIPWAKLPLVVPTEVTPWTPIEGRRIGGVSAFGFSGTNVHVVVEAAPEPPAAPVGDAAADRPLHLLALSAKHPAALTELAARYAAHLETNEAVQLADVCYSANTGRADFGRRLTAAAASTDELAHKLRAFAEGQDVQGVQGVGAADAEGAKPKIAFLFTGQGSQYAGMGRELYKTQPTFRAALDRCAAILQDHLDTPLLEIIDPPPGAPNRLDDTTYTQPALFAIEWALAQLWQAWGVTPNFVMGHSVGEYVAAALAGVFSLEDALKLIAARGRLMGALPAGGAMAAVFASEETVAAAVEPYRATVSIAAVNGPDNTVISGRGEDVAAILQDLKAAGVKARGLKVSHAFHSPLLDPMLPEFAEAARTVSYHAPRVRLVSNVTGELAPGALAANAEYWRGHSRAPVRFAAAIDTLRKQGVDVFLEIGPGSTLIGMGERCLADREQDAEQPALWAASLKPPRSDWAALLDSVAALYRAGVAIDWEGFDRPYTRRRIALPTYPFQRGRYWLPQRENVPGMRDNAPGTKRASPAYSLTRSPVHPLLGRRLRSALAAAQYEIELGQGVLPYLDDHRVQGAAILPGAAFMEAALAAGKPAGDKAGALLAVEDLLLLEALAVPDGETRSVQWIVTPGEQGEYSFECYSHAGEDDDAPAEGWRLHARARLVPASADAPVTVDLAAVQAALPDVVTADEHYAQLAANGLDFGLSLLGVQQIWRKGGEALGRIAPTAAVTAAAAEAAGYALHPALLDAHLQVIASAMPAGEGVYLPFSLDRLRLLRRDVPPVWSHVVLQSGAGDATLAADLQLLGEGGEVVAVLEGLRLKRLDKSLAARQSIAPFAKWLYEVAWEPRPLDVQTIETDTSSPAHPLTRSSWPPLDEAAADLARRLEELEEQHNLAAYALDVAPQLDSLSLLYIAGALAELGWQPRAGERFTLAELEKTLGVAPRHSRLLRRLCEILAEEGVVESNGEAWQVIKPLPAGDPTNLERSLRQKHTAYSAEIELTARCGRQLAAALSGRIDPVHLLFPGGDLSTTEALYRESPSARVYNGLMRATVELLLTRRADQSNGTGTAAPLRVLEIGGGTGGTTAYLLPMLPADRTEYLFTDISPLFVARAEEKFGSRHPFAAFAVLDLEKEPAQQGLGDRQFDLIVAANVIHATADLRQSLGHIRRLLAPDGVLVMLEVTGPQRWVDVTFGLTDGWWRFVDRDLRQGYPLISIAQWKDLLGSCGFDAAVTAPAEDGAGFIDQAVIVAHNPVTRSPAHPLTPSSSGGRWLLLADRGGLGDRLGRQLAQKGAAVTTAFAAPGDAPDFGQAADGSFTLDPMQPQHFRRLLAEMGEGPLAGVVHLWSLDAPAGEADAQTLTQAAAEANAGALHLVQALAAQEGQAAPRLWFVTRGAQSAPVGGDLPAVAQSPLWGLAQAVTLEHPELQLVATDLDGASKEGGDAADADVRGLLAELLAPDGEDRSAWRGGERLAARLVQSRRSEQARGEGPVELEIGQRGTLQQLALRPLTRRAPGRGEVEIRVAAAGLNFKDLLNTLGMYPGDAGALGGECAGEVAALGEGVTGLEVGQRVLAIAPGAFRSYVVAQAPLVAPLPEGMSFAEGASIPIAFVTAAYTLRHLGKLRAGERVLIHAAAGGVGLAAVQMAQMVGAEVIATAGSESKRAYLRSLGVRHVFDSRSLSFAEGVREVTGGRGVDVALNSLAGPFIPATLALLAAGGRFLEIGKSGLLTPEQAAALGEGRQYFSVDWTPDALQQPALIRGLLDQILEQIAAGKLRPLPQRSFAMADAQTAFRFMAQARHIGKIVLLADAGDESAPAAIRSDASYLITGGLRGLGLLVGGWLAEQGAGGVVLVGRSAPDDEARAAIERMEASGCRVLIVQADIAQRAEVERVLAAAAEKLPPLAGIVHAAGVLDDGALLQQSWARFAAVLAPKVQGAWHLHQLTEHLPLDFFVLFSSLASLFGSPGQGNHSAANAFLDALAHYRRGQGLPGTSINWGIWSEVGIAAQLAVGLQRSEQGLGTISPQNGLRLLAHILEQQPAQIGVTPITWPVYLAKFAGGRRPFFANVAGAAGAQASAAADTPVQAVQAGTPVQAVQAGTPPTGAVGAVQAKNLLDEVAALAPARRKPRLIEFIKTQTGQVLGLDPQAISERTPLSELGLDSLMAVELRNVLSQRMGLKRSLPATLVFDYPTIQAIADYLLRDLPAGDGTPGAQASPPAAPPPVQPVSPGAGVLDDLETLSDEEVERRLAGQFSG